MKSPLAGCAVWACLPLAALAQTPAADPASPVPATVYQSVFTDTSKGVETGTVPWRQANASVGQFMRGHADILKWEAAQQQEAASAGSSGVETPAPASAGSPTPAVPAGQGTATEVRKP